MEYAVTSAGAPARFRLTGSRAGAVWPVVAMYTLPGIAALGIAWLAFMVLGASLSSLSLLLAFGAGLLALAWRTAMRWRTVPGFAVDRTGFVVEHPELAAPLRVAAADVSYVVWSDEPPTQLLPGPRFPVVGTDYVVRGYLYEAAQGSLLTLLETSPSHRPTVAVVFRVPRDLPVRAFSAMRGPLPQYPVNGSFGLLLPVTGVAAVVEALDRAGIPNGPALPAEHAAGLV